ncbi:MAG: cytochrome c1 [Acidiferrobacterales bacterium]|jgi:ubiquinol-cytochrome c reductase cytochrome c1 subunit|nr:cytochrome c1 [Acidiferrobacterales bacterium]
MLKKIIITLSVLLLPVHVFAAEGEMGNHIKYDKEGQMEPYNFDYDLKDQDSLQHGAKLFVNYCLSCHSAGYMRYNRMGKDLGISDKEIEKYMGFITDNEGKFKVGALMKANLSAEQAKAAFNTVPPDLSLTARSRGPEWIYTYLLSFYRDETAASGWNNALFPHVAMPHVLSHLQGTQRAVMTADGRHIDHLELVTPGTLDKTQYEKAVRDLTNFMVYLAEPAKLVRYRIGVFVILFLIILAIPAYLLNKEYWKDVH